MTIKVSRQKRGQSRAEHAYWTVIGNLRGGCAEAYGLARKEGFSGVMQVVAAVKTRA